jgi:hypothetical protein
MSDYADGAEAILCKSRHSLACARMLFSARARMGAK